ncbi:MAG: ABC transporter permease subunit [Dehalococcoidia bacterium]|nr:ABC transporter permease subunit [Dehalococcoidia bacterium]
MLQYALHRLALAVPTLFGLTVVIFIAIRVLMPVDVVDVLLGETDTTFDPTIAAELREKFGLDGPLPVQYARWLGRVAQGDLGRSFVSGRPVTEELLYRVPTSLQLGLGALVITVLVALPIGMMSAVRRDTVPDYLARGGAILLYAVPGFWLAILVLVFGSVWFRWAPSIEFRPFWEDPLANLKHIWLPMLILGLNSTGTMIRLVRTQVLEVLGHDYVRTARAKGLSTQTVYFRHVLRNALLPIVTVVGLQIPNVVSGTVIFEQIFLVPGVGRYLLTALQRLDIYVILGTNLFFGTVLVFSNLVVDILYGVIDPRIRFSGR